VAIAQAIHGLIKANDGLTARFLRRRSTRHEDASLLFRDIILQHKIDQKHAPLRKLLTESTSRKSEFDYGGAETGRNEAERWLTDVEKFVKTAREILGVESSSQYR